VYASSDSWYCYRCSVGGDAIDFVMRLEGRTFRAAVDRLEGIPRVVSIRRPPRRNVRPVRPRDAGERACLAAAVELYARRLAAEPAALGYLAARGVDLTTIERCRLGYAAGGELVPFLRRRGLPVGAARRVGLLRRDGSELMAGRVVVPEVRGGQPIWLIGRVVGDPTDAAPKYLGLPGPKPLLGWEDACRSREAFPVEGVFGYLTLLRWGYPALGLLGTHVRPELLAALMRFERLFLVMDDDEPGRAAAETIEEALAPRAVRLVVPGVIDVDELAPRPDGRARFARAAELLTLPAAA
jgi:DNA primase